MYKILRGALCASVIAMSAASAEASSLTISPTSVEVPAPAAASRLTLENDGKEPTMAQVRVFKWVQTNGKDELIPTRDVVASPPAIKLMPGKKTMIRVVRVNKAPVAIEETYRVEISEVPPPAKNGNSISFAIQYSVPVFFTSTRGQQQLSWNARVTQDRLIVEAANSGTRRAKIVNMKIGTPNGKTFTVAEGLAGYVLPESRKAWVAKSRLFKPGSAIQITAQTEQGPVNATATVTGQ